MVLRGRWKQIFVTEVVFAFVQVCFGKVPVFTDACLLLYLCMYTVCKDCTIRIGHICSEGFTCKDRTMFVDALWVHCVGIATDTKSTIIDRDNFNVGLETTCNPMGEDSNMYVHIWLL